jgi:predicted DNA-binding protein (UPF0278 family)
VLLTIPKVDVIDCVLLAKELASTLVSQDAGPIELQVRARARGLRKTRTRFFREQLLYLRRELLL